MNANLQIKVRERTYPLHLGTIVNFAIADKRIDYPWWKTTLLISILFLANPSQTDANYLKLDVSSWPTSERLESIMTIVSPPSLI